MNGVPGRWCWISGTHLSDIASKEDGFTIEKHKIKTSVWL